MTETPEFVEFGKIPRLSRQVTITEKLDGTNAQLYITEDGDIFTGSRTRWITPDDDNYGFAGWAQGNKDDILKLGPGRHYGEWWGQGIQRKYGLKEKRFSLFNASRWCAYGQEPKVISSSFSPEIKYQTVLPETIHVVPILWRGLFNLDTVSDCIEALEEIGSWAAPGFMNPEGIIIYHEAARTYFKKTITNDEEPKGKTR